MGCRLQVWLLFRNRKKVGAPFADFTLFIVDNGNADFSFYGRRTELGEAGKWNADFNTVVGY